MRALSRWILTKLGFIEPKHINTVRADSEFTAEVVQVVDVRKHPNADKLDIIRFAMYGLGTTGYEVITQRGSFTVGDLGMYFSVDCLLPTKEPEFAFLKKEGKDVHRLRAARLRGVFSQGLLVPARRGQVFGQQVANDLGVTYYRPPEPGQPTQPQKKRKAPVIPEYGVDSLKKLPNLFEGLEPSQIVVTEKIHGTNFRFGWIRKRFLGIPVGWRFVVGSHRVIKTDTDSAHFYGEDVWTEYAARNRLAERTRGYPGFVFYAELYGHTYSGARIQDLTYGLHPEAGPSMAVFDVLTPMGWMEPRDRMDLCLVRGFQSVPQLPYTGGDPTHLSGGNSLLAPHQIREGVVVETQGVHPRRKAKFVSEAYLMRDEGKHAPNPKKYNLAKDATP